MTQVWISISEKNFSSSESLRKLQEYNISKIRINLGRERVVWAIQAISFLSKCGYKPQKILLDIGNQKARIHLDAKYGQLRKFRKGDTLLFHKNFEINKPVLLNATIPNPEIFERVTVGDIFLTGDNNTELLVRKKNKTSIVCCSLCNGSIKNGESVFIKEKQLFHFNISQQEIEDVNKILLEYRCGIILSFVENNTNLEWSYKHFPYAHTIIPKIETRTAMRNLNSIFEQCDFAVLGRGDLGLNMGIEKIGILQEKVLKVSKKTKTSIIIATEILESMHFRDLPLRSEVIDITNCKLKGSYGILLTSETAASPRPFRAIEVLFSILKIK